MPVVDTIKEADSVTLGGTKESKAMDHPLRLGTAVVNQAGTNLNNNNMMTIIVAAGTQTTTITIGEVTIAVVLLMQEVMVEDKEVTITVDQSQPTLIKAQVLVIRLPTPLLRPIRPPIPTNLRQGSTNPILQPITSRAQLQLVVVVVHLLQTRSSLTISTSQWTRSLSRTSSNRIKFALSRSF
jgi:selenocysteine-specific translation elongation factor